MLRCKLHILGPVRRPDENDSILIPGADHLYDLFCIGLNGIPGNAAVWLIAYFVDYIGAVLIFGSHFLKKSKGFLLISFRIAVT